MCAVAIVVVTYNRAEYLSNLLGSIFELDRQPDIVVIIDNCSSDSTPEIIEAAVHKFSPGVFHCLRMGQNLGGSGGFHEGVKAAYNLGADWFWLMDDDVEVLPDGLSKLLKWSKKFQCLHGRRYDFDGSEFFWQPVFSEWLGMPLPYLRQPFSKSDYFLTNSGCFEGMFISKDLVEKIGFPDPRFFITWDDAMYGWLASKFSQVAYINEFVIKRARMQRQIDIGFRHLNDGSDLFRYHVVKNREYVRKYLVAHGCYSPFGFFVGSVLNFLKEILRLIMVEKSISGLKALWQGWRDGSVIKRAGWELPPRIDHD